MKKNTIRCIILIYISVQLCFGIVRMSPDLIYISIIEYVFIIAIFLILDSKNKKTSLLVEEYVSLLEKKEYSKIESILLEKEQGYQVKVLLTCLYLYQGDECKYIKSYEDIEKQKVMLGNKGFKMYLTYTNLYYKHLRKLNIEYPVKQEKDYPYNEILNLIHDEKYALAISLIEKMKSISAIDFFMFFRHYLMLTCHNKLNMDIGNDINILKKLAEDNILLKNTNVPHDECLPLK